LNAFAAKPEESRWTDPVAPNFPPSGGRRIAIQILIGLLALAALYPLSRENYLLFHGIIEVLAITVAITVFSISWNTRSFVRNETLLILGVGYLVVGALDLLHALAYKGMGVFPPPGANLATQFWIAARYLEAATFLLAALLADRGRSLAPGKLLACYLAVAAILVAAIYPLEIFPICFRPGAGLTPFKIVSEYLISAAFALSGVLLVYKKAFSDRRILRFLLLALAAKVLSELFFTLYGDVTGIFNFLGHGLKLVSLVLIYRALVGESLRKPYASIFRNLVRSETALRSELEERRRTEEELRRAKEAAEAATRAKSEFLATMSHEIRTPMNAIIGMTELTLGTELTREQGEYLDMVKTSSRALLKIINDILDFSKIEAGRMELDAIRFNVRDTVEKTAKALAVQAHQKGLELLCHIPPDVPDAVIGDPHRLRQVLFNLIGNAIKFTEAGQVMVRVEAAAEASDRPDWIPLRFAVSDTGIGIAEEKRDRLFRKFSQVESAAKFGGTGLGLTISREIVELMGGVMDVESRQGVGSTFYFIVTLPLADPAESSPSEPLERGLDGMNVLVVDDNATNRRILQEMLSPLGMAVETAAGGDECLDLLHRASQSGKPFQLLLLDSRMPGRDGFAVAGEIRQNPVFRSLTILMITSDEAPGIGPRCREAGIASFLVKPVGLSELCALLAETFHLSATSPPILSSSGAQSPSPPEGVAGAEILLAEDNLINQRLVLALLERKGWQAIAVESGRGVLDALVEKSYDLILMDVQMPGMDGLEATRVIRQKEAGGEETRIPIIGLTAHASKEDRDQCLAAGMDAIVTKPIDAETLFGAIEGLFGGKGQKPALLEEAPIDLSDSLKAVNGDRKFLADLAAQFVAEIPTRMSEIQQALEQGDSREVERCAHQFKSVMGIFGGKKAHRMTEELESLASRGVLARIPELLRQLEGELERAKSYLTGI